MFIPTVFLSTFSVSYIGPSASQLAGKKSFLYIDDVSARGGTPLIAITAMDALDFRREDNAIRVQMQFGNMLRELEKAAHRSASLAITSSHD
eukprot:2696268-Amphidinium_carterae.1